jgi:hypothetical protein
VLDAWPEDEDAPPDGMKPPKVPGECMDGLI